MTNLQMIQFVGIMVHGFQLVLYDDCDFPWQFSYFIGAHAVMFFFLFAQFYVRAYLTPKPKGQLKVSRFLFSVRDWNCSKCCFFRIYNLN